MRSLLLVILAMTLLSPAFSQTVAYVTPGGGGTKDGSSWTNAYDSKAFALAVLTASNIQYWVAAGIYYPSCDASGNTTPTDPRTVCWSIKNGGISIYGGFAGTETLFSQRNIRANPTIFSGDIGVAGDPSDNSYHVWNLINTGTAELDGCTITAGNANSPGYADTNPDDFGGGITVNTDQTTIIDSCLIVRNSSVWGGGGMDIDGTCTVSMTNDVISNNICYDETAYGTGGGIQLNYGTILTAIQCVFANDTAGGPQDDGGGALMMYEPGTTATLIQCTFFNNITASTVRPGSGTVSMDAGTTLTLGNTLIWANEAAMIYATGATVTAQNSIVKGLTAIPSWVTEAVLFADSSQPAGPDGQWRTADDGLGLRTCSPAINKGNNGYATFAADIADQPRIYNNTVDIGAYEFQAVNPIVTPSISVIANPADPCPGQVVQFSATVGGGGAPPLYQWEVNGNDVGVSAIFSSGGLSSGDVVSCTMTSTDACDYGAMATAPDTLHFVLPPTIAIRATDNDVCAGSPISISASFTGAAAADFLIQWSVNGVTTDSTGAAYTSSQLQNGDLITCILTPGTGACSTAPVSSNTVQAVIYPLPSVSVSPADTSVPYGTSLTLRAATSGDVVSLQWAPIGSSDTALTVVAETTQVYTLTVQTANQCSASVKAVMEVYPVLGMPSGFTPNGDGHNDVFRIPPGVQLTLQGFSVYDRLGARVFFTQNPEIGWDGTFGGHPAPAGAYVYILQGVNEQGQIYMKGTVMLIR
jgi:gliding motility-associated-like protein